MATQQTGSVVARHFALCEPLQPFFTSLYLYTVTCPSGKVMEETVHPEWALVHFNLGTLPWACIGPGPLRQMWRMVVTGPTSKVVRVGLAQSRIWGMGLRPAGYARFIRCAASDIADTVVPGLSDPAFAALVPLLDIVSDERVPAEETAARIEQFLLANLGQPGPHEDRILACQEALGDEEVASVEALCERVGLSRRSLERLCARYFGFSPKLLLRRQRFLRSLAHFTLTEGASWIRALDGQYHDQAHFVREFKAFMGMTPSEYSAAQHPILAPIMAYRMDDQGALPQRATPPRRRSGKMG